MASSFNGSIKVYKGRTLNQVIGTLDYKLSVNASEQVDSKQSSKEQTSEMNSQMNNTNPSQLLGINPISMNMKVYEANLDKSTPIRRLSAND